jgi:hypothetical protein
MAVPLYGFETWSSAIRKDRRLTVFGKRMLRNRLKMGQRERDKVNEEWIELHNVELYNLHSSPNNAGNNKARKFKVGWFVALMGGVDSCRIFLQKS